MLSSKGHKVLVTASAALAGLLAACTQSVDVTGTPVETGTVTVSAGATGTAAVTDLTSTSLPATAMPSVTPGASASATAIPTGPDAPSPTPLPAAVLTTPTLGPQELSADSFTPFLGGQLVAQDETLLGELLPVSESFKSICNPAGEYGSQFSLTSIFNPSTEYGGQFGVQSPFNPDSAQPPAIVVGGEIIAYLTVSPFMADSVYPDGLLAYLGCR